MRDASAEFRRYDAPCFARAACARSAGCGRFACRRSSNVHHRRRQNATRRHSAIVSGALAPVRPVPNK